jgi:hypothetical protein
MPALALDALESVFADVVDMMPAEFDSHQFILRLAHQYQRLYVEALAAYAATEQPFQIVHSEIARRLLAHEDLVIKVSERSSPDIFGQMNSAAVWRKV